MIVFEKFPSYIPSNEAPLPSGGPEYTWVVVKIMVPFWIPIIIRHLLFRVPKKGA